MLVIPLTAVPNQVEVVPLDGNSVQLAVNQRSNGLYIDVFMNGLPIVLGVICENLNRIIRGRYLGFPGELFFDDTQGTDDPDYTGLGARFQLFYIEASEIGTLTSGS